jgi:cell filamentation protein
MADETHRSRYDTTGNPEAEYVDAAQRVLRNKLGIVDRLVLEQAEEEALLKAYTRLWGEVRLTTPMTCALVLHVHSSIFGDLYEWAGKWRTVWISKPGMTWPAPDFLDQHMREFERDILSKHPAARLSDDEAFCRAVARIQGEFLVIHPFREGNARTIKLLTDLLAAQTGRAPLTYDRSEAGAAAYIAAAKAAFVRDYAPLSGIIRKALTAGRPTP